MKNKNEHTNEEVVEESLENKIESHDENKSQEDEIDEKKEKDIHPEIRKILDYVIPHRKIRSDLLQEFKDEGKEEIKLSDLIKDEKTVRFDEETGKPMINHPAVLSIWEGVGAELFEPRVEKTGNDEYQVVQGVKFADGTVFYATGEASKRNTDDRGLSGKFPVNQAHIRAINKAIIRGMGLYHLLLTEEESDEFKTAKFISLQNEYEGKMRKLYKDYQTNLNEVTKSLNNKNVNLKRLINEMLDFVAMPDIESNKPSEYIFEIENNTDLKVLTENENKVIAFVANQILRKRQENENKRTEMVEEGASENSEGVSEKSNEDLEELKAVLEKIEEKEKEEEGNRRENKEEFQEENKE